MVNLTPNPSYSLTIRFQLPHQAGMLALVTQAIATAGGNIGQIDLIERTRKMLVREITIDASSSDHAEMIIKAVKDIEEIKVLSVYDQTFSLHKGGKIRVECKVPLKSQEDLAMAYTPGVGRICTAIAESRRRAARDGREGGVVSGVCGD
jgi:malate dehydrogenase (oxaloacetate-decarboxylating)